MNNSINYSYFVDMLLNTSDDFEPYGCGGPPSHIVDVRGSSENSHLLHRDNYTDEPLGE